MIEIMQSNNINNLKVVISNFDIATDGLLFSDNSVSKMRTENSIIVYVDLL